MSGSSLYVYMFQWQPFEDSHEADVAHGENEFDTSDMDCGALRGSVYGLF